MQNAKHWDNFFLNLSAKNTTKEKGIAAEFLSSTQTSQIHEDLNSDSGTDMLFLYQDLPSCHKLSSLRSHLSDVPILALTATAAPKVQKDVISSLNLQNPLILESSFNRPIIYYEGGGKGKGEAASQGFKGKLEIVESTFILKANGEGVKESLVENQKMASQTYPYPSTLNVSNFVSLRLNQKNYLLWRTQILALVESQDMLGFLDGEFSAPAERIASEGTDSDGSKANPVFVAWRRSDRLLRGWITSTLSEEVLGLVVGLVSSADVWKALEAAFAQNSQEREFHLTQQLSMIRKDVIPLLQSHEARNQLHGSDLTQMAFFTQKANNGYTKRKGVGHGVETLHQISSNVESPPPLMNQVGPITPLDMPSTIDAHVIGDEIGASHIHGTFDEVAPPQEVSTSLEPMVSVPPSEPTQPCDSATIHEESTNVSQTEGRSHQMEPSKEPSKQPSKEGEPTESTLQ
ncbi:hypothetical protein COLO4_13671 [Corchorus olitorius]|uniref:Retrotransposon Copia-like N-terminal domain-containing protein n=1 Tax=Corchorus olitorius TaxID=93759 RepID=A0A1R3JVF1_9ROSI|nr:hypothetical protein COLO4_13671 [Corchorus olitorius]